MYQSSFLCPNNNLFTFNKKLNGLGFPILLSNEISFALNKRWQLFFSSATDLNRNYKFHSESFGARLNMLLSRWGNPLILRPSVSIGSQKFGINFPTFTSPGDFRFDGKKFNAEKLKFSVGVAAGMARFAISLDKKISGLRWLYLNSGYALLWKRQNNLFLNERSGFFLFRKERAVPLASSGAIITENLQPLAADPKWFNNFYLDVGVRCLF